MNAHLIRIRLLAMICLLSIRPVCYAAIPLPYAPDTLASSDAPPSFKDARSTKHLSFFKRLQLVRRAYRYEHAHFDENNKNGMASVICGGSGLVFMVACFAVLLSMSTFALTGAAFAFLALWAGCSIAALITGVSGMHARRRRDRAMAVAGMVLGIVGTSILTVCILLLLAM